MHTHHDLIRRRNVIPYTYDNNLSFTLCYFIFGSFVANKCGKGSHIVKQYTLSYGNIESFNRHEI